ncbi:MAG: methyltransferase domain-containing protein [candidate division WOR-3 bacterium]
MLDKEIFIDSFLGPGKKAIDMGSWDNIEPSVFLASRGLTVFAIDRYQRMLDFEERLIESFEKKRISREVFERIFPLKADANCLPFSEESIDGIFFIYSVPWLEQFGTEPLSAYKEAMRVLKNNGLIFIIESTIERAEIQMGLLSTMMKAERLENVVVGKKHSKEREFF